MTIDGQNATEIDPSFAFIDLPEGVKVKPLSTKRDGTAAPARKQDTEAPKGPPPGYAAV